MHPIQLLFLLVITLSIPPLHAADKHTAEVVGRWQGSGIVLLTHMDKAKFFGEINATLSVKREDHNSIDKLPIVCMTTQKINLENLNITSQGDCLIGVEENVIFASFECSGPQDNCMGTFTVGGGTGRFSQMTGRSKFHSRTEGDLISLKKGRVLAKKEAQGVLTLTDLYYEIPDKK